MKKLLFPVLLLAINCLQGQNQRVYVLDSNRQIHDLRFFTYALVDSSNTLSSKDIVSGKFDAGFTAYSLFPKTVKNYTSYWLKLNIHSPVAINNWWLLLRDSSDHYLDGASNDYVDVYTINNTTGTINHQRTGAGVRRSEKSIKDIVVLNRVTFAAIPAEKISIYIKIYNEYSLPGELFYPQLQNPIVAAVIRNNNMDIMCTIAFLFSVLSFFFFFFVKDKAYLWFGLYTFILSQHYLLLHPRLLFVDWYIPEHPALAFPVFIFLASAVMALFLLFGRSFINLRQLSPRLDRIVRWLVWTFAAVSLTLVILMAILHRSLFSPWHAALFMIITLVLIIRFAFFKTVEAKIFVAGGLWMYGLSLVGILWDKKIIALPFNPWALAQLGQLLIYCIGLAYKIRLNERSKAEASRIREMDTIKSTFFANISHEFRTPLTLIQGPLQQIEEQANDNEKQNGTISVPWRHLKTMRRNTDRLLELVNQLLDLSRLDSGKMKLQVIKGDAVNLLKILAASFDSMAERKQIHYHVHFAEQPSIIFFDKDKLEKIFINLLGNAFKYTPEKGTVSVHVETDDKRMRISVEDNGPGIAKKELDKVFDRFYQAEGTEDKGSGIGLALVKELVDLYGGQISVSSEPGSGSRFRVSLPVDTKTFKENEFVFGEWKPANNFITAAANDEKKATITHEQQENLPLLLIVEDNPELRQFISETVQIHYQVLQAGNGKEGYEVAVAQIPDIVVSDIMMPVMDGFDMTEKIKKDERTSHIPVILLTAKAGQQHKIEGLETGADDYLTKPFEAKELLARILNLVTQRKLLRKKFAGSIQLKPSEVTIKSIDETFLASVLAAVEKNMEEEDFSVEELSKKVMMSRSQLHRKLIALIDQSPGDLIKQTRLLRAKELLQKQAFTPSQVAYKVGFSSHTYFSKCFKEAFGISPGEVN